MAKEAKTAQNPEQEATAPKQAQEANAQSQNNEDTQENPSNQSQERTDAKLAELTGALQHLQAEFENYRKRVERDRELQKTLAKKEILLKLLQVTDNFELALKTAPNDDFAKGIELIYTQLMTTLEQEGLKPIETKTFDPQLHEALLTQESDQEKNTILEVLQKGYELNGQVIRTAKVKVAK